VLPWYNLGVGRIKAKKAARDAAKIPGRKTGPTPVAQPIANVRPDPGTVMTTCPVTRKPVSTGIVMDKESFASSTLLNNSVSCPHCGRIHTWSKQDAYIAG
jgi:hypothetical protein